MLNLLVNIMETDVSRNLFIVVTVVVLVLLAALLILFIANRVEHKKMNSNREVALLTNNQRFYTYDYSRGLFFYFDRLNPRNERIYTSDEFLSLFISTDKFRIENWLKDITTSDNSSQFIQVDRKFETVTNTPLTCILILTKIDKENKIIHFEMHLLPYIDTVYNYKISEKFVLKNDKDIEEFLQIFSKSNQGALYYLRLYALSDETNYDNKYKNLKEKIKNEVILKYLSPTRKCLVINNTDYIILDTSSNSKIISLSYASTISNAANDILINQQENNNFEFLIGISIQTSPSKDYLECKNEAKSMIDAIIKKKSFNKVLIYDPDFTRNLLRDEKNKKDTLLYIKNSTFNLFFLPSLNVTTGKLGPVFLNIRNYGIDVSDFKEIVSISSQLDNGDKCIQLFRNLDYKLIKQLACYTYHIDIVLQIPYDSASLFFKAIDNKLERNFTYTLLFDEKELSSRISIQDQILKNIKEYKKLKNIQSGLLIKTSSITIKRSILEEMSYYVVTGEMTKNIQSAKTQADLEKISVFFKSFTSPLCYINLKDTIDVDLAILYSGKNVQCDAFSKLSSKIYEFPERVTSLVVKDDNKLIDEDLKIE